MVKFVLVALTLGVMSMMTPSQAFAEETGSFPAAIWIDPDGCEHWILDLGVEGMMSPHLDHDGKPVCGRNPNICMEFPADIMFATARWELSNDMVDRLTTFFSSSMAEGMHYFTVAGHTDNVGDTYYNYDLGRKRAQSVAAIANQVGAISRTDTYGEMQPIASNDTEDGRRRNRRVEIFCSR